MQVTIPAQSDRLHPGQLRIVENAKRFNAVMCGRRFGKSILGEQLANETALAGYPVGWFAPTYKYLDEAMRDIAGMLAPVTREFSKTDKRLFLKTGGVIDFWTMDGEDPGRSRAYKRVIVDEAGLVPGLLAMWQSSIRPTLTDYKGDAWFLGTPKGMGDFATLYAKGEANETDWAAFRAATLTNPHMDPEEVEAARRELPPDVFAQEYEGVPAADEGNPFGAKALTDCEVNGPIPNAGTPVCWGVDLAKYQDWTVACGLDAFKNVVELHRWRMDWGATEDRLQRLIGDRPALIDATGVGDPIVERLQGRCPAVEGFVFSSRSKQMLMEGLAGGVQSRELRIPSGWLMDELRSFRYEYTRTGGKSYAAPTGMHDDGVCALALAVQCFIGASISERSKFRFRVSAA